MTGKNALTPARNAGPTDFPDDDAIARSKRILAMVDTYHERPDRMNRNALRGALMDEFTELLKGKSTRDAALPANASVGIVGPSDLAIQMYMERHMATETEAKAFFAAHASNAHAPVIVETTVAADTRKAILEEAALECRARITGARRTADHEAAECMNAIRAMYLPAEQPKKIEDWS
jgi:hypothetical protein